MSVLKSFKKLLQGESSLLWGKISWQLLLKQLLFLPSNQSENSQFKETPLGKLSKGVTPRINKLDRTDEISFQSKISKLTKQSEKHILTQKQRMLKGYPIHAVLQVWLEYNDNKEWLKC